MIQRKIYGSKCNSVYTGRRYDFGSKFNFSKPKTGLKSVKISSKLA